MKKSTILILFVVFLGSVLIVGVFGMNSVPFEQRVYVKEISPTSVYTSDGTELEIKWDSDKKGHYVRARYDKSLVNERYNENYELETDFIDPFVILINTKIEPMDSTNKELKIVIIGNDVNDPFAEVGERGEIIVYRPVTVHVRYTSQDTQPSKTMDFYIYFRAN